MPFDLKLSKERLRNAIEFLKKNDGDLSNTSIGQVMGYRSKNYVSDCLSEKSNISDLFLDELQKHFNINKEWIKTGEGDMIISKKPYHQQRLEIKNNKSKPTEIPFIEEAEAIGGYEETNMNPITKVHSKINIGDILSDSEMAIRVYGNSMMPNYPPGCVVGLKKLDNLSIMAGEVHVIETSDRRVIKRLFYPNGMINADSVIMYSDNTMKFEAGPLSGQFAYPAQELHKEQIRQLYIVTGVIKRNTM